MTKQERISEYTRAEIAHNRPTTQEDACRLGARASIPVGAIPKTDEEFIAASAEMATGLFGPAFQKATDGQKAVWMMMCEDALRYEVARHEPTSD